MSKQLSGDLARADSLAREIFSDIANKWALLIVETIGDSTKRFMELKTEVDGISHKMLTQNLYTFKIELFVFLKLNKNFKHFV